MTHIRSGHGPLEDPRPGRGRQAGRVSAGLLVLAGLGLPGAIGCRESAPDDLIVNQETTEALVFVKAEQEETLNRTRGESNLYRLSPISPDGTVTPITDYVGASVSDPCVSFDGKRILFSMRLPEGGSRNIYEIGADGQNLRQITSGGGDDFDPLYLPDGRILFTSSRADEMDEYNHAPAEHLYTCDAGGANLERISFNQSDDFDPALLPDGRIVYTRWEHFGSMNRFPLFFTNPDGTGTFHQFGPHDRNFFHPQPTPDGRIIAIESTEVEGDVGPVVMLKPEQGPADPVPDSRDLHWDVLSPEVNTDGPPWAYGAFKYPFPLGEHRFVVSYTLPAATEEEVDYALYTFTVDQDGSGTSEDPAKFEFSNLTFLFNDPLTNEYDAQLLAPRTKPPVIPSTVDHNQTTGVFLAQDVFNRGTRDGQDVPQRGIDPIRRIAVLAGRPTPRGMANDFSLTEFEARSFLGYAPVQEDGSFRIEVPADTPISFATLDEQGRGFVVKRTWLYVRPGEEFDKCTGCHEDRAAGGLVPTNPNPVAATLPPTNLVVPEESRRIVSFEREIGPVVASKCVTCHIPTFVERDSLLSDGTTMTVVDTIPAPGDLDLRAVPDTTEMGQVFPLAYVSLVGEEEMEEAGVLEPAFPRRSLLIDWLLAEGDRAGQPEHPGAEYALTEAEKESFLLWVLLGAQFK